MSILYLIPTTLGETNLDKILPAYNAQIIGNLKYFVVEDVRTARRFLKKSNPDIVIDALTFYVLNQHTSPTQINSFIKPLLEGFDMGVISEAGCPAIADPGADVVALAQENGCKVVPLVGPSSLLLALMGSGFNGQSFAFAGYLPQQSADRVKALKRLENRIYAENQSQLFIETPYRNVKLVEDILLHCQPQTKLCIAVDLTLDTEYIVTKTVKAWKGNVPELHKRPAIFILYK